MHKVAWDTETCLIGPGQPAPPLVCTSIKDSQGSYLLHHTESKPFFDYALYDNNVTLVGHNLAYDFGVVAQKWPEFLPQVFKLIEEGRAHCTMVRMKLIDIAANRYRGYRIERTPQEIKEKKKAKWIDVRYDLSSTYNRFTGQWLKKDEYRLKYREYLDVPLEEWPEGAQQYPLEDARATLIVHEGQENVRKYLNTQIQESFSYLTEVDVLGDQASQMKAAWWMWLMAAWGIRTSPIGVLKLQEEAGKAYQDTIDFLKDIPICEVCGEAILQKNALSPKPMCERHPRARHLYLVSPAGKRSTKAAKLRMIKAMGGIENCRLTAKGQISLDKEACAAADDPLLDEYGELSSLQTVVNKDLKALRKGRFLPIHSFFNSLIATGRTSSSGPNVQNIRRLPGIRECFVPRSGMVFLNADYDGLELRALAQVCLKLFGRSKLAEVLNSGQDPHLMVACTILGISYEEAIRRNEEQDDLVDGARQTGKVANFGFPGGLGIESLILFAKRSYKVTLTVDEAKKLKEVWIETFPEMGLYFAYIGEMTAKNVEGFAAIEQLFTKRIRSQIPFTVACNTLFQGLGADATKSAGWLISKACYIEKDSPLYGCRIVNFIHDEFLLECPEHMAHAAVMELKRLMILGALEYFPDVPPTVSKPLVARCWSKKAKQVWKIGGNKAANSNDELIPWEYAA